MPQEDFYGLYVFDLSHIPKKIYLSYRNSVVKDESQAQQKEAKLQVDTLNLFFEIMRFISSFPLAKEKWFRAGDRGHAEFDPKDVDEFTKYATAQNFKIFKGTSRFDL